MAGSSSPADQADLQDRGFAHYLAAFDGGAYAKAFSPATISIGGPRPRSVSLPDGTERDKENKVHARHPRGQQKRSATRFCSAAAPARAGQIIGDTARAAQQIDSGSDLLQRFFAGAAHPNEAALKRVGKRALDKFMAATPGLRQLRKSLEAQARQHGWLPGLDGRRVPVRALYTALNYIVTRSRGDHLQAMVGAGP